MVFLSLFIHFQNKLLKPTFLRIAGIRIFETFTVQVQEKSSYGEKTFQKQYNFKIRLIGVKIIN